MKSFATTEPSKESPMPASGDYLHYCVLTLILLGCILVAVMHPDFARHGNFWRAILIGVLFGTLFAQTTVASVWTVTGPMRLIIRVPLALLWMVSLLLAFILQFFMASTTGMNSAVIPMTGICLLGQWLLAQIPVWMCKVGLGLKLCRQEVNQPTFTLNERQFSIRQLMIVTTIIAVILGIGRALVNPLLIYMGNGSMGELPIFVAITVSAILLSLPLMLAAMLRRYTVLAILGILLLIAIATPWEATLIDLIENRGSSDPTIRLILAFTNTVTAIWILLFAFALRMNGYQLTLKSVSAKESMAAHQN